MVINGTNHTQLNTTQSVCAVSIHAISTATTLKLAGGTFAFVLVGSVGLASRMAISLRPSLNPSAPLPEFVGNQTGRGVMDTKRRQRSETPAGKPATGLTGKSDSSDYGNWQKYGKYINSKKLVSRPDASRAWSVRGAT